MTAQQELQQAIQWMQDGQRRQAAALLNRLLDSAELDDRARAAAYVWLAESRADRAFKIRCLEQALEAEPENRQIRQGLNQLLATDKPPDHLPTLRRDGGEQPLLEQIPRHIGIDGGANGLASGIFISQGGLLATTSYAVGSAERLSVIVNFENEVTGKVVRRYPGHDIALIAAPMRLARKPSVAPPSMISLNAPFVALGADGTRLRGRLRRSHSGGGAGWLRTNIAYVQLPDAGGNPMYDERDQLIGILTRNADAAGNVYAFPAARIMDLAKAHQRDRQLLPKAGYCRACGGLCRAVIYGGRYCETCGAIVAMEPERAPVSPQAEALRQIYGENGSLPCPHCGAGLGHHRGRCLRCGRALTRDQVASA